jgi:hypothetical protein
MQGRQYNKKEAPARDYFHGNESFINVRLWKSKSANAPYPGAEIQLKTNHAE